MDKLNITLPDIFSTTARHMIKGLMIHEQFANYYDFLGLQGYSCCHEFHYLAESMSYRKLCKYYINHYGKLIDEGRFDNPQIIPESWYRYHRSDVSTGDKRAAVETGLEKWQEWEKETLALYSQMYVELIDLGEIASADFVKDLICDVSKELEQVDGYLLNKKATNYDIVYIIEEQDRKREKYKKKKACLLS